MSANVLLTPLTISEAFFPLFSLGTLGTGLCAFGLLAQDRKENRVYWGIFTLLVVSFLTSIGDMAVLTIGGIHSNIPLALQFSRFHEVSVTFFIVAIPLTVWTVLPEESAEATVMKALAIAGAVVVAIITIAAFAAPDLFVSITEQTVSLRHGVAYSSVLGRGEKGPLFVLRDGLLGLVLIITFVVSLVATARRRLTGSFRLIVLGVVVGILIGGTALIANFTGSYPGPLNDIPFSRVGLAITVFTLLSTAAYVLEYVQQSKVLDETIRELKHRRDRLSFLAYHNDLTQMANKQAFIHDLDRLLEEDRCIQAYLCDIDAFRQLQDSYGFHFSERLLRTIGKRVEHVATAWGGSTASAYHIDGDAFAVLLPTAFTEEQTRRFEQAFVEAVTDPVRIDDQEILMSTAVGHYAIAGRSTVPSTPGSVDAETVLQRLRRTVTAAKGRHNAVRRYSSEVHDTIERSQRLVQEMRHAVRNRSFRIEYQPILDGGGDVVAAEALIRWDEAPPGLFIPLAEQSGLIVPITGFVVEQVIHDVATIRKTLPEITIHINISARHIVQLGLLDLLTRNLETWNVPSSAIGIEITETSFGYGEHAFTAIIQSLRSAGFHVAIDDFGTGYSSFSYLKQIPADCIKIDQSFVAGLPDSQEDSALVDSIIDLARRLDKTLVAEGIENAPQREYLIQRGVDFFQGFHFSRAVPLDRFMAIAKDRQWQPK